MKSLADILEFVSKDTIYEKLDINKVNIKDKDFVKNFPLDGTMEEIAKFLKDHGFKEVEWQLLIDFSEFKQDIEKENRRVFTRYKDNMIRFANTSNRNEIDDDNPVFVINKLASSNHLYFEFNKWWELRNIKPDDFLAKIKKNI